MKLTKIAISSLIVATMSLSVYGADTLTQALTNGKFSGGLKAVMYDVDKAAKGKESITSLGIMLNYITAPFYGVSAGIRLQSSNSPWANDAEKVFFKGDLYGPGAVLEEAYFKYKFSKSSLKIGRQFIKTPLLSGNGSRIIHESFEGYTVDIKDIPDTRLFLGYINKYLTRTNLSDSIGTFGKRIFMYGKTYAYNMGDGIWTAYVQNKSIKDLKLTGQYLVVKDATLATSGVAQGNIKVALAQAEYKLPLKELNILTGVQYGTSNVGKDDSRSGNLLGFKVATKYKKLKASLGYVINNKDKSMLSGVGISSNWAYAGDIIGLNNYLKDTKVASLNLLYHFAKNIMILGKYSDYMVGSSSTLNGGKDLNAYDFIASYAFKGSLKDLSTKFHYENESFDSGDIVNYRFYVNYKF